MDTKSGNIKFVHGHQREVVFLSLVQDLSALNTFANQIQAYSNAGIEDISYVVSRHIGNPETPSMLEDTNIEARVMLKEDPPVEGEYPYRQVHIPAPKIDLFDLIDEKGYRLKQVVGAQIATAYSQLTGKTYVFQSGWICGGERS